MRKKRTPVSLILMREECFVDNEIIQYHFTFSEVMPVFYKYYVNGVSKSRNQKSVGDEVKLTNLVSNHFPKREIVGHY